MKSQSSNPLTHLHINASGNSPISVLSDLWIYRECLFFLVWRNIKVRYSQTFLGIAWAILQPFLTMVVFSIFFGRLAKIPSDGVPYPAFAFVALLPWQLFAFVLTESSNSLVANQQLITKVYVPRIFIPLSMMMTGLVDFSISFLMLLGMMFFYGLHPSALPLASLPFFIFLALMTALGTGLWLSALNVRYRDVRYTIPFLTQFWLFLSPVAYPGSMIPENWRFFYHLNPLVGVIEGFRWALLGANQPLHPALGISILVAFALLVSGFVYFRQTERTFADII